jgi:hypothetical protein
MKKIHATRYLLVIGVILVALLGNIATINASPSNQTNYPPPITDLSKAVPFLYPLDNTVNPASPKYNPSMEMLEPALVLQDKEVVIHLSMCLP